MAVWLWIKKYWQIFVAIIAAVAAVFFFRKRQDTFAEDLKKIQDAHAEELQKVQAAREEERVKLEKNQRQLEQTLIEVKKRFDEQERQLDARQQKEIESIVKEHGNEPDVLAQKLAEVTGFVVILPKDEP